MAFMTTFASITVNIVIIAHYMSCFFFYIGMEEVYAERHSWLDEEGLLGKPFRTQYITSMYWAFTTMSAVGYGDICPQTRKEKTATLGMMMFSCGIFAFTVNSVGNMVQGYNRVASDFQEKRQNINRFTLEKGFPAELRLRIRRYLDYCFEKLQDIKVDEK